MPYRVLTRAVRWLVAFGIILIVLDNVLYRERGTQVITLYTLLGIAFIGLAKAIERVDARLQTFRLYKGPP